MRYEEIEEKVYGGEIPYAIAGNPEIVLPKKWQFLRVETILKREDDYDYEKVPRFHSPEGARDWILDVFKELDVSPRERAYAIFVDQMNSVIGLYELSIGTATESLVSPNELFKAAMLAGATALFIIHNHPSGDPDFSKADLQVLERLLKASAIIGIPIVDFMTIGYDGRFKSARYEGYIKERKK